MSSSKSPNPNRPSSSASSASSSKVQRGICKFYLDGRCKKGGSCPDFHPQGKKLVCPHFAKGFCTYGDKCKKHHDLSVSKAPPQSPTKSKASSSTARAPSTSSNLNPKVARGASGSGSEVSVKKSGKGKGKEKEKEKGPQQDDTEDVTGPSKTTRDDEKSPCIFYQMGNCSSGNCEYRHINPHDSPQTSVDHRKKAKPVSALLKPTAKPAEKHSTSSGSSNNVNLKDKTKVNGGSAVSVEPVAESWAEEVQAAEDEAKNGESIEPDLDDIPSSTQRGGGWDQTDDDDENSDGQWGYRGQGWKGEESGEGEDEDEEEAYQEEPNADEPDEEQPVHEDEDEDSQEDTEEFSERPSHEEVQQRLTPVPVTPAYTNAWPAASTPVPSTPAAGLQVPPNLTIQTIPSVQPTSIPSSIPSMPSVVPTPAGVVPTQPPGLQVQPAQATMFSQPMQATQMTNPYVMQQQMAMGMQMAMPMQQSYPMPMQFPGMMPGMPFGMPGIPGMPTPYQPFPMQNMAHIPEAPATTHWSEYADPLADGQKPFCKLHARGMCAQGLMCTFRHALTVQNFMYLFGESQPLLMRYVAGGAAAGSGIGLVAATPTVPLPASQPTIQNTVASTPVAHPAPPQPVIPAPTPVEDSPSSPPTKPRKGKEARPSPFNQECKFYPLGKCNNGDKCPFQHTQHPPEPAKQTSHSSGNLEHDGQDWSFGANSRRSDVCRFWKQGRYCKFGAGCQYSHDGEANPSSGTSGPQSVSSSDFGRDKVDTPATEDNGWSGTGWGDTKDKGDAWDTQENGKEQDDGGWGQPVDNSGWDLPQEETKSRDTNTTVKGRQTGEKRRTNGSGRDSAWESTDSRGSRSRRGPRENGGNTGVCFHYQAGRCRRSDCRFAHDLDQNSSSNGRQQHQEERNGWGGDWGSSNQEEQSQEAEAPASSGGWGDTWGTSNHEGQAPEAEIDVVQSGWGDPEPVAPPNPKIEGTEGQKSEENTGEISQPQEEAKIAAETAEDVLSEGNDQRETDGQAVSENEIDGEKAGEEVNVDVKEAEEGMQLQDDDEIAARLKQTMEGLSNEQNDASGWSQDWSTADVATDSPAPAKRNVPCKFYGQGYCRWGNECTMLHVDPTAQPSELPPAGEESNSPPAALPETEPELEPELEPPAFEHPSVRRSFGNSQALVTFGPDSSPQSVTTVADLSTFDLHNFPSDTTVDGLGGLLSPFMATAAPGNVDSMRDRQSFHLRFPDILDARQAFLHFHGKQHSGRTLVSVHPRWRVRDPLARTTIKLYWPKPSCTGWAFFTKIGTAKAVAKDLQDIILNGRQVKVEFCSPKKAQKDNFAVEFTNLAIGTSEDDLKKLSKDCKLAKVQVSVKYDEDPVEKIKAELQKLGAEEDPDLPPNSDSSSSSVAFATFRSEAFASEIISALKEEPCLGDASPDAKLVHYARYRVSCLLWETVYPELEDLQSRGENYKLQYASGNQSATFYLVYLSAFPKNFATFTEINMELRALLHGEVVQWDGNTTWDSYFESEKKRGDISKSIQAKTKCFVSFDPRAQHIRVFGPQDARSAAKDFVDKLMRRVQDSRYELEIARGNMRQLIHGKLDELVDQVGVNKLSFDIFAGKITVGGTTEDLAKVTDFLQALEISPALMQQRGRCEICHGGVEDPIVISCRHVYCSSCLNLAIRSTGYAPLQCVASHPDTHSPCGAAIDYYFIKQALSESPQQEDTFLEQSFYEYVRRGDQFFFCPSVDCKVIHRVGTHGFNIHCLRCKTELCSFCRSVAHIGKSCEEMSHAAA